MKRQFKILNQKFKILSPKKFRINITNRRKLLTIADKILIRLHSNRKFEFSEKYNRRALYFYI